MVGPVIRDEATLDPRLRMTVHVVGQPAIRYIGLSAFTTLANRCVAVEFASGSKEMADTVAESLRGYKVIMLCGHGCFAVGQILDEAFQWVSTLEEICDIILETKLLGEQPIEYRKRSSEYAKW
jgi:ribulose-5-phosphate 4-epimerase/fuculose-1-phosphate aldolase